MTKDIDEEVHAIVQASQGRRVMACLVVYSLGLLMIYLALTQPLSAANLVLILGFGVLVLYLGERLRQATRGEIVLTDNGLFDQDGAIVARFDEIQNVDRGAFAFKPSNGFMLKLNTRHPRRWAPGIWWRLGRRVGVGGATSAGQTKFMAEQIALRMAMKDNGG